MSVKAEYLSMFGEMPYLLTTQSYDNEDYQLLMKNAILRGKPLTEKEIGSYFGKDYDDIVIDDR